MGRRVKMTIAVVCFIFICSGAFAQSTIVKDFKPACDSLSVILQERTGVCNQLKLKTVMKRGNVLDFYFTESLGDWPWESGDPHKFKSTLKSLFPEKYSRYKVGEIYSRMVPLNKLVTPSLAFDGNPSTTAHRIKNPPREASFVKEIGDIDFDKGLTGRTITLWQSHGKYYDINLDRWMWQRPTLFQTVEDMFTQSFVLPFLVPMLENAGAYVMLPRERDFRKEECITDNDSTWVDRSWVDSTLCGYGIDAPVRTIGQYGETGEWKDAGVGFADAKAVYSGLDNPFRMGTARQAECLPAGSKEKSASAIWIPKIDVSGDYAVYISYKSLPHSSESAHYIINHAGGKTEFIVNQKIGGGMWVYLGTFPFESDGDGSVVLQARTPKGSKFVEGSVVTADAVKFGGGMGNIERGGMVSGMPRSCEGARYFLQWAGADSTLWYQNEGENDYKDDFMSRGDWSAWLSGRSRMNPKEKKGQGIPIDLSLGFHSDAGITPNDSIVGTLAIYTYKSEGCTTLPSGDSRLTSREYASLVQNQIVHDIRNTMNPDWSKRQIWDRGYRESRTPTAPAMLLELLSHQNFADMKYGRDPQFQFIVSRAVYKGMLKYLSNRYGCPYVVQPLPPAAMAVDFRDISDKSVSLELSWSDRKDNLEPTADAKGYILYTRMDDGAFDTGRIIKAGTATGDRKKAVVEIEPGHVYSWKVVAFNEGGKSFPSEILSAGIPADMQEIRDTNKVLIINNFDRVGPPAFVDSEHWAGFNQTTDRGVAYIREIGYIGDMYQFSRDREYIGNENPGFGATFSTNVGEAIGGNSFDYPAVHGKAILRSGRAFTSCSAHALERDTTLYSGFGKGSDIDLICGKQLTCCNKEEGEGRFSVFAPGLQKALVSFSGRGCNLIVSGANVASDVWDRVFPVQIDSVQREMTKIFIRNTLGYKWITNHASQRSHVASFGKELSPAMLKVSFHNAPNAECYSVESPDGIIPASKNAQTLMRYTDSGIGACVGYRGEGYRSISFGFPLETIDNEDDIYLILSTALDWVEKPQDETKTQ